MFYSFRLNTCSPRGAVDDVIFHSGYLSSPHLPSRRAGKLWEVFGMTSSCVARLCFPSLRLSSSRSPDHTDGTREAFDDAFPCHSAFVGGLFCRGAFSVSPHLRHAGGTRQVLIGGLTYSRVCVSFNSFSSRFPGFISRPFRGVGGGF